MSTKAHDDLEALGPQMIDVEWRGRTFTIPAEIEDWSAEAVEAFEGGKAMSAVHLVLGDKQWETARKASRGTVREIADLFDTIAKAAGFEDAGE